MKKLAALLVSLLLVVVVVSIPTLWYYIQIYTNPLPQKRYAEFIITNGSPASTIVDNLVQQQFARSSLAIKIYLRLNGLTNSLRPGGYQISKALTPAQVINQLTKGPEDIWITFPEGWRREQIALRLSSQLADFDIQSFLSLTADLEGQLFPDTYLIPPYVKAKDVVELMTRNFVNKSKLKLPLDKNILIMASLIEREVRTQEDRGLVAGIMQKRLEANWPLQIDATVQYARDSYNFKLHPSNFKFWEPVFDTKFPSSYNTYLNSGLPPAPISNPGLFSIQAAQNPTPSPYWYYLTDTSGTTHYSKTLSEHNFNVDKYLRP